MTIDPRSQVRISLIYCANVLKNIVMLKSMHTNSTWSNNVVTTDKS